MSTTDVIPLLGINLGRSSLWLGGLDATEATGSKHARALRPVHC